MVKWILKGIEPLQNEVLKHQTIRSLLRKFYNSFFPNEWVLTELDDVKYYINTLDVGLLRSFVIRKKYEEGTTKVFKHVLGKGITVVDVGAGIGYYSLIASGIVGEEGKVFAFEPDPANYEWLRRNIGINNCANVIPLNQAISDRNGPTRLFHSKDNISHHSIALSEDRDCVEVEAIVLDDFLEENGILPDVVKMDIEGAEILALKGMEKTIEGSRNLVMFIEYEYNKEELANFLSRYFDIYHVTKEGELTPFDAAEQRNKKDFEPNLYCVSKK